MFPNLSQLKFALQFPKLTTQQRLSAWMILSFFILLGERYASVSQHAKDDDRNDKTHQRIHEQDSIRIVKLEIENREQQQEIRTLWRERTEDMKTVTNKQESK
ncbi:hypothetical protein [Flavobacterium sp.]|uniref:hypothetical protein n=1 Tax=Flavobacterium sp. TaxID=239 RepID=UPI00120FD747|nr:hypothetical protein [Flavobacterium sp.]RZJ71078.1 MAG: hypothetical protein EOO49_11535 [Flavobacterium sp.]